MRIGQGAGLTIQYSWVMTPPSFTISAMALSIIDAGVLSGNETTTGFCGGGRANTAVNKAKRKTIGNLMFAWVDRQ